MAAERKVIDRVQGERGEAVLAARQGPTGETQFELFVNGAFLMSTASGPSSTALAAVGLSRTRAKPPWHVLIGGLGLGFTLRRALGDQRVERVTVVELEPDVIRWNRGFLGSENAAAMLDPRLEIVQGDVRDVLGAFRARYDMILLDVDNGPTWTIHPENAALYAAPGLLNIRSALRPGGVAAFWASVQSAEFENVIRELFGSCSIDEVLDMDEEGRPVDSFIYWAGSAGEAERN